MKERIKYYTSESVSSGHPDAAADSISNYLHDKYVEGDKHSKVGIEVAIFGKNVFVGGEVNSNAEVDVVEGVKQVFTDIGYSHEGYNIENHIIPQSREIHDSVVRTDGELGAGDQGHVFGYATNGENTDYMPMSTHLAHKMAKRLEILRKNATLEYLYPDAKTQVTVKQNESGEFLGVDTVVVSTSHKEEVSLEQVRKDVKEHIIDAILEEEKINSEGIKYLINTAGEWSQAVFSQADSGITGRKLICNVGYHYHGGGNANGKDASKCDRSGNFMARYLAKNILHDAKTRFKEYLPQEVLIQIGYAIGVVEPVSINIEVRSRGELIKNISYKYQDFVATNISCSTKGIIDRLDLLNQPLYPISAYGHFGGHKDYTWERLDIDFGDLK